jgi:hypothetical protein
MPKPRPLLSQLATASRFVVSRRRHNKKPAAAPPLGSTLAALPAETHRTSASVMLRPRGDWIDTGVEVSAGESVTLIGQGRLWISAQLGLGCGARVALWYRIGAGPIAKSLGDSTTFTAERNGSLWLVAKPPGEWLDESGRFDLSQRRAGMSGALEVAVVVWKSADGLNDAAATDAHGPFARELARRTATPELPIGWSPLWRIGQSMIFGSETLDGRECLRCRTQGDVGILRHPVRVPLDDSARLDWTWRVLDLPSAFPEDLAPTHDYLSIAVEFDNGRDLTYIWSHSLAVGTSFHCPLAWWRERETHLVVRSGRRELGAWQNEQRSVLSDYHAAIGGPTPSEIVAVWLIAVSVFQQRAGRCDYASIAVRSSERTVQLL